jgi:hypothetical protein
LQTRTSNRNFGTRCCFCALRCDLVPPRNALLYLHALKRRNDSLRETVFENNGE